MFDHYTKPHLEAVNQALRDRVEYLEASKDEIDKEISVLDASITDVEHQLLVAPDGDEDAPAEPVAPTS